MSTNELQSAAIRCNYCGSATPCDSASCQLLRYNTQNIITVHLDQIRSMFTVPVTITIIIRSDDMPDGRDMIITNDDLDQVVGAIMRRGGEELH